MDNLFLTVLSISLTTSVVIITVIMLGTLINKRYMAKWKYLLWIVLALRLLIPFNFKLSDLQFQIQIPAEVGSMEMSDILGLESPISEEHFTEPLTADSPAIKAETQNESQFSFTLLHVLGCVWIIGAIGLLLWQLTVFFCYKRGILRRGKRVRNPVLLAQLRGLCREFGIRKKITFIIYKKADSPMVVGFWHPVLVLPKEGYTQEESYYILRHELIHLKRHDVLVKLLLLFARDFHWFNPVIHLMHREAVLDMELACDEAVVRDSSYDQREAYTETLMSTLSSQQHKGPLLSTQFSCGKRVMKKRFKNILTKVKKKNGIFLFAVILILTVTVGTLTTLVVEASTIDGVEEGNISDLNVTEVNVVSDENDVPDENDVSDEGDVSHENTRESTTTLTLIKEGMEEEEQATLYIGEGYSFYLIDDQWVMTEPGSWYAKSNENVRFWIDRYEGLNLNQVEEMLTEQGYSVEGEDSSGRLYKYEENTDVVNRVLCYETESGVWTMNYVHSLEGGEGWAVNIRAMFSTFVVTE